MELKVGQRIAYTSAVGRRFAFISEIKVGPTAKPGFMNTWMTLVIPVQPGTKYEHSTQIPADNGSLKMFKVALA